MSDTAPAPTLPAQPPAREPAQPVLPHHITFAALVNTFSKTYRWTRDEALRHSRENALAMRRDVWIMRCLRERKEAVAHLPWHLEPADAEDPAQEEAADRLTAIVKATPHLQRLILTLLEASWYGVYAAQMVWEDGVDVAGEPALAVTRHLPVNGDKLQLGWDGVWRVYVNASKQEELKAQGGNLLYGDLAPMLLLDTPAWRERFVVHQHETDDADYFEGEKAGMIAGVGIRDRIYWATWLRDEMLSWGVDFMQKVGTGGLLVFPYDGSNAVAAAKAKKLAEDSSQRNALTMPIPPGQTPKDYAPFLLAPNAGGIDALTGMIKDYFDRNIELYIVGQSMSSGADKESGLGGTGRSEFAKDTKWNIIKTDARNLEETLTRDFVAVAQKWNTPEVTAPVRWVFDVPDPDAEKKLAAGKQILDCGLAVKTAELYAAAGYSPPTDDDEIVQLGPGQMGGGMGDEGEFGGNGPGGGRDAGGNDDAGAGGVDGGDSEDVAGPVKYAAEEEGGGHWVTIGAKGEEGDKHGGTPVFIQGGKIVRGPKALVDKHLHELGKQAAKEHTEDRDEAKKQAEHARAMDTAKAKKDMAGAEFSKKEIAETVTPTQDAAKRVLDIQGKIEDASYGDIREAVEGLRDLSTDQIKDVARDMGYSTITGSKTSMLAKIQAVLEKKKGSRDQTAMIGAKSGDTTAQPPAREGGSFEADVRAQAEKHMGPKPQANPAGSVASPQQQRKIDGMIAEGERRKGNGAEQAPAREADYSDSKPQFTGRGQPKTPRDAAISDWQDAHQREGYVQKRIADHERTLALGPSVAASNAIYDLKKELAKVEKAKAKAAKAIKSSEPSAPESYEADALRDQIATDIVAAPVDPEAAKRAKENTSLLRRILRAITGQKPPEPPVVNVPVNVTVPEQPAPVVNITPPAAPSVTVNVPEQPAPVVNVPPQKPVKVTYERDAHGNAKSMTVEPKE